jgi:hypothetical protein
MAIRSSDWPEHTHKDPPSTNTLILEHTHIHTRTHLRTHIHARAHTHTQTHQRGRDKGGRGTFSPSPLFLRERACARKAESEGAKTAHGCTHTRTHTSDKHANSFTLGAKQRGDRQTWMGLKPLPKPFELSPQQLGEISSPNGSRSATSPVYDSGVRRGTVGGVGLCDGLCLFVYCLLNH